MAIKKITEVEMATDFHPDTTFYIEQDGKFMRMKAEQVQVPVYVYDKDGRKYTITIVNGEVTLTRVWEKFPGKEILAEIPSKNVWLDGGSGYARYTLRNDATGETVPMYDINVNPFIFNRLSDKPLTKAGEMLAANTTGAYTFIATTNLVGDSAIHTDHFAMLNGAVYLRNSFSYEYYGAETLVARIVNLPYMNTSGEYVTFSEEKMPLEPWRASQVTAGARGWNAPDILAFVFGADGSVTIIYCDQVLATFQAPADWQSWAFADWMKLYNSKLIASGEMESGREDGTGLRSVLFLNDAVSVGEIVDYHNYLINGVQPENILSSSGLFLQPGDTVALYAKAQPDGVPGEIAVSVGDTSIAAYRDGKVTGLATGNTKLTLQIGDVRAEIPVHVGQQTGEAVTSERVISEIEIINPVTELQVGDEWALYAVALTNDAVPYDVGDDNIVSMTSSDPSVISVEFGVLRARAKGTATITVTDHTGNVTKTMEVGVVEADNLSVPERDVYHVNDRTHDIYNDGTHPQETTAGIQAALDYAAEQGYHKVVFNSGTYLCNADYGTLAVPSGMIVDFQGAELHLEYGTKTAQGYSFIKMDNCEKSVLMNLTVYAEQHVQTGGAKSNATLSIQGNSSRCKIINCHFWYSPGFNVTCSYTRTAVAPFKLSNVEAGGIDSDGNPEEETEPGRFRAKDYIDITGIGDTFGLGNMQGYQGYRYMRARIYDIYFYDTDKELILKLTNCVQYQQYNKPAGAAYCKIVFYQTDAPTSGDPDYAGVAHIYTAANPEFTVFQNCSFKYAVMTGISPQGGIATRLDHCTFEDNGSADPYSHIDWEDGRVHIQGHIVRDCIFRQVTTGYRCNLLASSGRDVVLHGNTVIGGTVSVGSECQQWRMYHNDFCDTTVFLASKGDMVFAGNLIAATPTVEAPTGGAIHLLDNTIAI